MAGVCERFIWSVSIGNLLIIFRLFVRMSAKSISLIHSYAYQKKTEFVVFFLFSNQNQFPIEKKNILITTAPAAM